MIKDINGLGGTPGPRTGAGSNADKASQSVNSNNASGNTASSGTPQGERVELSSQVQTLQALESKLQAVPDVDIARVDAIKQALEEGNFNIDDLVLADKLINSDTLLGE